MASAENGAWIHKLSLLKPAPYHPWLHAIRIAVGTSLPLFLGWLNGDIKSTVYIAIGAFLTAITVRLDPYGERFRQIAISTAIALTGCFLGPLVAGHGVLTFILLVTLGMVSGVLSGYGAAFSVGALNMLVLSIITIHIHTEVSPVLIFVQYLAGAFFVAFLLGIEALFNRGRPERRMLGHLLANLADLASAAAAGGEGGISERNESFELARRKVTDASKTAYATLIEHRSHGRARTRYALRAAKALGLVNQLTFVLVAGKTDRESLRLANSLLTDMADACLNSAKRPPGLDAAAAQSQGQLAQLICELANAIWPRERRAEPAVSSTGGSKPDRKAGLINRLRRTLVVGPEVLMSAVRLSAALAVAVIAGQLIAGSHSYWIPMTVAVVLKPDFGSVFMRAIHRCIGTMIGVGIAALTVTLLHNDIGYVAVIAVLCTVLPWAGLRSYAAMVSFLTPVILLIIAIALPGSAGSDILQRLLDTLLGAAIALVAGYLIWPRSKNAMIETSFASAMAAVGALLNSTAYNNEAGGADASKEGADLSDMEFAAYRRLSDLRTELQRLVAEPPPAGREAAAWFPAVASAERLCDHIVAFIGSRSATDVPVDKGRVDGVVDALASLAVVSPLPEVQQKRAPLGSAVDAFSSIEAETAWLLDYRDQLDFSTGRGKKSLQTTAN